MNLIKKYTSVAFSVLLVFSSAVSLPIEAAKGFSYKVTNKNKKTAILTKIDTNKPIELKDPIDGYSITEIKNNASKYKFLKARTEEAWLYIAMAIGFAPLVLPSVILLAAGYANGTFDNTQAVYFGPRITSVNLPNCFQVGMQGLVNCRELKTVNLQKCHYLEKGCLHGCIEMESLNVPSCTILNDPFDMDCEFDKEYRLSHKLGYLPPQYTKFAKLKAPKCIEVTTRSFAGFTALKKVDLSSCKTIGGQAFYGCKALENLELPCCTEIKSESVLNKPYGAFENCESLKSINISNLIYAGACCFKNCTALKELDLHNCKEVQESCFKNCKSLETVLLDACTEIPKNTFDKCISLKKIRIPNVVTVGETAFLGNENLERIDLPNCNSIGVGSFKNCKKLCNLNASNLHSIEQNAFEGDESLEEIYLPNCKVIKTQAFRDCKNLKKITVPKSCKLEKDCLPYDLLMDQKLEIVRM